MTIKNKLIANMLVTATIIIGISMISFSSMRFLQEKLAHIAEKSTPAQIKTVEFQRELHSYITDLIKIHAARNMSEYSHFRQDAKNSFAKVEQSQKALERMKSGDHAVLSEELQQTSDELFAAAEARIRSDIAAGKANAQVSRQMKETVDRLKELEDSIRTLQATHAASFAKALENTERLSAQVHELEGLHNQTKDLLSALHAASNSRNNTAFLIARGKVNTLLGRMAKSRNSFIASEFRALSDDLHEFLQLQASNITKKDGDARELAQAPLEELTEKLNRLRLTLNQEIELANTHLQIETNRQREFFSLSGNANAVLLANSELVTLGLMVTGNVNRLFIIESGAELDRLASDIHSLFIRIQEHVRKVDTMLDTLHAVKELKILRGAAASLAAIRNTIYADEGIVTTLRNKLSAIRQADTSSGKLYPMVSRHTVQGNESIAHIQEEQERSIVAANRSIQRILSQIFGIGLVAIIIAIVFGFWIFRSVVLPLRTVLEAVRSQQSRGEEKAALARAVAEGDLSREVIVSDAIVLDPARIHKDEMGKVLKAVAGMSKAQLTLDRAFAEMTSSLRRSRDEDRRRDHLKSGLHELDKILRDDQSLENKAGKALAFMAGFLGAGVGIVYRYDDQQNLLLPLSGYAITLSGRPSAGFRPGEGLAGQVAQERTMIRLDTVPPDYLPISSALGEAAPLNIIIVPIMHNDTLSGVLELGSFNLFTDDDFEFLEQALEALAITIGVNHSRQLVHELLEQTQAQAEELRAQQEELQQTNEELQERARLLAERQNATT